MKAVEIAVKQPKAVRVDGTDYFVEFPVPAVVEIEAALGRPMRGIADWFRIQPSEVCPVLAAGFRKHHPESADGLAEQICDSLEPEEIEIVIDGLCAAAFPKAMAKVQAEMEKLRKKGAALPNVQSADAT
jgi:hypothetical protein